MSDERAMDEEILRKFDAGTLSGWERIDELRERADSVRKVIVLVHGTFAARPTDLGDAWWQTDGRLSRELSSPSTFVIAFNWSGANSETARATAGRRLWVFLHQIEALRKPYVLVAHSHGGMVVMNALNTSTIWANKGLLGVRFLSLRSSPFNALPIGHLESPEIPNFGTSKKLGNLRGWITVGTPFLNYRKRQTHLETFLWILCGMLPLLYVGIMYGVTTPFVGGPETWIERTGFSLFLGCCCYGPWLLGPPIALYRIVLRPRSLMRKNSERYTEETKQQFAARHTALWSKHDEAINALRAATQSDTTQIVPRMRSFTIASSKEASKVRSDIRHWIRLDSFLRYGFGPVGAVQRLLLWILRFGWDCIGGTVNMLVLTPVDWIVLKRLTQTAFGDDLAMSKCTSVTANLGEHDEAGCIEETTQTGLFSFVQQRDKGVTDQLRRMLYESSTGGVGVFRKTDMDIATDFLVHNSYFKHEDTYQAIVSHIHQQFEQPMEAGA